MGLFRYVNAVLHEITKLSAICDRSVVRSSVTPSAKYCCSRSSLRLTSGSTYDAAAFEPSAVMGSAAEELMVCRLTAGGNRILTSSPTLKEDSVSRRPKCYPALPSRSHPGSILSASREVPL